MASEAEVEAAAKSICAATGGCYGASSGGECIWMEEARGCDCAAIARLALEAAERVREQEQGKLVEMPRSNSVRIYEIVDGVVKSVTLQARAT